MVEFNCNSSSVVDPDFFLLATCDIFIPRTCRVGCSPFPVFLLPCCCYLNMVWYFKGLFLLQLILRLCWISMGFSCQGVSTILIRQNAIPVLGCQPILNEPLAFAAPPPPPPTLKFQVNSDFRARLSRTVEGAISGKNQVREDRK